MADVYSDSLIELARCGYVMLHGIFSQQEMDSLARSLDEALRTADDPAVLRSRGKIYGSRSLQNLAAFPAVVALVRHPRLVGFTKAVLGPNAGIVRVLFFDKPPDRSWSLPWHKDLTIAVKRNDLPSDLFHKPTVKAGVPHVEAARSLLESMLTIRIHLDAMTEANGPLYVVPGSHRGDGEEDQAAVELHAGIGDVLAMRPLLSHCSKMSSSTSNSHRRVIHFETAANAELPDGFEWHWFIPLTGAPELAAVPTQGNPKR